MLIAGGGVAGVEALLALRALAEEGPAIELVSPDPDLAYRPLRVTEPFGLGEVRRFPLKDITLARKRPEGASTRRRRWDAQLLVGHVAPFVRYPFAFAPFAGGERQRTAAGRPAARRHRKLRLKPATFPAARSGGSVARRRTPSGTWVSYRLSVEAKVAFKVERRRTGRKKGGKCILGAHSGGRPCTRYTRLRGGFNVGGVHGANKFRFTGRLRSRKLVQGRYRLVATPSTDTRLGAPARARFKIS